MAFLRNNQVQAKNVFSTFELSEGDRDQNRVIHLVENKWQSSGWPDSGNEICGLFYESVQGENRLS